MQDLIEEKTCYVCKGYREWQSFFFIGWPREVGEMRFRACTVDWTHSVPTDMFER